MEGRFKQSEPDGFCRVLAFPGEGQCELGYFKEKEPQGKYSKFDIQGHCLESGIKEGNNLVKSCEINSFQTRLIKTANDAVGRTPVSKPRNNFTPNEFDHRNSVDRQFNATMDRGYGYTGDRTLNDTTYRGRRSDPHG